MFSGENSSETLTWAGVFHRVVEVIFKSQRVHRNGVAFLLPMCLKLPATMRLIRTRFPDYSGFSRA
ncbi:hypothetical protein SAMN04488518_11491 [Pseudovibrio ascidiaceicola]|uniref:Uncharacterized protein n=1 Tax=Pseudovibrio ascidiaceicola TaxID=285279 RepID=A0A1I4E9Z0_9HYPH|nr:hypothetical protein SAMN04488518_11491 [Pseudovibrio ascidiaceicola]